MSSGGKVIGLAIFLNNEENLMESLKELAVCSMLGICKIHYGATYSVSYVGENLKQNKLGSAIFAEKRGKCVIEYIPKRQVEFFDFFMVIKDREEF